ncbi:unnamed protein product, partial [Ectocarpus sp. 8 AP-2014]
YIDDNGLLFLENDIFDGLPIEEMVATGNENLTCFPPMNSAVATVELQLDPGVEMCEGGIPSPTPGPSPQPTAIAPDTLFVEVMNATDGAWEAVYTPDGTHVYLTGKESDSIVAFEVDSSDGSLTMVGDFGAGTLDGPTVLTPSPDGRCLFVVAAGSTSLTSLSINGAGSGTLTYAGTVSDAALAEAWDVVASPLLGDHVYVSSPACGCIITFAADLETCGLTYVSNVTESLVSPTGMAVSPDGLFLYGTDSVASGGALMLFSRNPQTGELALLQTISDSEGELGGATSVAVSPSGRDVYVASSNPGALTHFCVDESTGELQEVELEGATTPTQLDLDGASLVS